MPSKSNTSDNFKTTITCARTSGTALNSSAPDIDPATSGPKQASSAWHEFSVAAKRLFKHSHVYADIERTMNQQQAMETELQTQKERISSLESSRQERIKEFELRYDEWNEEKTALLRHNERVKIEMTAKHAEEMREVKAELDAERERANTLNKRLDRASSEVNLTQKELDICNERLKEWDRYTSLLIDVDFELLAGRIDQLFRDCYSLVNTYFFIDLPAELLGDHNQWEKQVNDLAVQLSLPPTNSPAAKSVRVAAALHVLATRLHANIFKPCYIPADCRTVKEILDSQFIFDMRQEKLMRALLLSVCAEGEVRAAINRAVHTTLEDILKHLGLFLNGGDHAFKKELEALLHRTARICTEIQRSKKTVEVSIEDGDLTEWAWGSLKDFGESAGPQTLGMWNLFPRIYVPEDDKVVYPGFVLWADQETPRAADQELKEFTARKRVRGGNAMNGSGSHRARRQSTVIQGSSPSTSPTSPRTDRFPLGRGTRRLQGSAVQD